MTGPDVIGRAYVKLGLPVLLLLGAMLAPQSALAGSSTAGSGSGGSGGVGVVGPTGGAGAGRPQVRSGNVTVSASGDGITITTTESAVQGRQLDFNGTTVTADAGDTVEIERLGRETDNQWVQTATGTVQPNGAFNAVWSVNHSGQFSIRAVLESTASPARASSDGSSSPQGGVSASPSTSTTPTPASSASGPSSPALTITVYHPSLATIYGPGFWGNRTACGQRLRRSTVGVASRTLKCGTPVSIYYRGRTLTVPVIDRGPYSNDATWDLTEATAKALGIPGTVTLGAVALQRH